MATEDPSPDSEIVAPVPVGLIADAEGVQRLRPALGGGELRVVGQAGMRQVEGLPGVDWFDDVRVMLAQGGPAALLVLTSPRAALALEDLEAVRALPLWRLPPVARNFAEGVELAGRLAQRPAPYRVASWWEAAGPGLTGLLAARPDFKPLFSRVTVSAAGPPLPSWRASLADAPGGVLATDAYDLLEGLLALRGLPERVAAGVGAVRKRPLETPRETEALAVALLRYESRTTALLEATWDIPPYGQRAEHHGADASLVLEPGRAAWHGPDGDVLQECLWAAGGCLAVELERFVRAVRHPQDFGAAAPTIERHLAVLALVQAVYLSARTGQPESPRKFYEVQKWPEPKW